MREQALLHAGQTQETVMGTDRHVRCRDTAVPSMVETHEACAQQESQETPGHIPYMEGSRPRDIGQGDNRQRTRGTDRGTWQQLIL